MGLPTLPSPPPPCPFVFTDIILPERGICVGFQVGMPILPTGSLISQQNVGKASVVLPKQEEPEFDPLEDWNGGEGLDGDMEAGIGRLK